MEGTKTKPDYPWGACSWCGFQSMIDDLEGPCNGCIDGSHSEEVCEWCGQLKEIHDYNHLGRYCYPKQFSAQTEAYKELVEAVRELPNTEIECSCYKEMGNRSLSVFCTVHGVEKNLYSALANVKAALAKVEGK